MINGVNAVDDPLTGISACSVLDATKVPLHPDTDGVVRVGQLETAAGVVVEAQDLTVDTREVLQAAVGS